MLRTEGGRQSVGTANSLAVTTYQIDNNFKTMKSTLKLLESSYDIWNFHKDSKINVSWGVD